MLSPFAYGFRTSIFRLILPATLGLLVVLGLVSTLRAQGLSCEGLISPDQPTVVSSQRVKTLQKDLKTLGFFSDCTDPTGCIDGKIGPDTRDALAQFCKDFGLNREVIKPLSHYAQIARAHPDWKEITLSSDFEYWINNQVALQGDQLDKLRRSGTARQIIDLLSQYKTFRKEQPPQASRSNRLFSYVLTPEDFEKLKTENGMIDQLEKLSDQPFTSEKDFLAAIEPIVQKGTDDVNSVLAILLKAAKKPATFVLTKASFKKLKIQNLPEDLLTNLANIEDVPYPNEEALNKEVEKRIGAYVAQLSEKYTLIAAVYADERTTYQFNADSIEKIKTEKVPEDLLAQIIQLMGVEYPSPEALKNSVKDKINQVNTAYRGYLPTILKHAQVILVYRLGESAFKKLQCEKIPAEIILQLQPLKGTIYFSKKKLQKAVDLALGKLALTYWGYKDSIIQTAEKVQTYQLSDDSYKSIKAQGVPDGIFEKVFSLKDRQYKSQEDLKSEVATQIKKATSDYDQYPRMVEDSSEQTGGYELNAQIFKRLRTELAYKKFIPVGVIDMVTSLTGNEYPRADLFVQALQLAARQKVDQYTKDILAVMDELSIASLNDDTFNTLKDGLKEKAIPDSVLDKLAGLKGQTFPNEEAFETAVSDRIDTLYEQFEQSKDLLLGQATKTHRLEDAQPPTWVSDSCDCGPRYTHAVYGFYPYWAAEPAVTESSPPVEAPPVEKDKTTNKPIDFSGLSRIGYFSLPFDKEGRFPEKPPWEVDNKDYHANFVIEAHRFKCKVDLVIYSDHWADWVTTAVNNGFQDKAVDQLTDAMAQQAFASVSRSAKNPLADNTFDGLTLNFDGFPSDPKYAPIFVQIIRQLSEKLKNKDEKYILNIVLAMSDLGKGALSFGNLKELVTGHDEAEPSGRGFSIEALQNRFVKNDGDEPDFLDLVTYFLIYLEEPTTLKKKALRTQIEDNFTGLQRRKLLRKIVPVLNSGIKSAGQLKQFDDDLTYLEDNFAGVGLWPLLYSDEPQFEKMNSRLKTTFKEENDQVSYSPDVLNDICPHRWTLYLIWNALVIFFVLYGILAYWIFEVRTLFIKYWPFFLVLAAGTILLTLALLNFSRSPANLQFMALKLLGTIVLVYLGVQIYNRIRRKNYP